MTTKKFFIAALAVSGALFGGMAHAGSSAGVEWITPRGPLGLPLPPIPVPRIVVTPPAAVVVAPQHAPRDRDHRYDDRDDDRYDARYDRRDDERWAYVGRHDRRRFVDRDRDGLDDRWERRQQWRRAQWQREQWQREQWRHEHHGR